MKLSKVEAAAHQRALDLVHSDTTLTYEDRVFVLENFHEGAQHLNAMASAFFTPNSLAMDFATNVGGSACRSVVDLCAGTGRLGFAVDWEGRWCDLTCIEINPDYVAVGRRVLPHARWMCQSAIDVHALGARQWDFAISNPPFGRTVKENFTGARYTGREFEFKVIDAASNIAEHGVFLLPQSSCPFAYSGQQSYRQQASAKYERFRQETGIELDLGLAIDTAYARHEWRGTAPLCEIVQCDFERRERASASQPEPQPETQTELAFA